MKLKILAVFCSILMLLEATSFAKTDSAVLAILEINNSLKDELQADHIKFLTDHIRTVIRKRLNPDEVQIMTRENTMVMLEQNNINPESCLTESQCEVDIGRNLGAGYIITSELIRFGKKLKLIMKLHNTENGGLIDSASGETEHIDTLETEFEKMAVKISGSLLYDITGNRAEIISSNEGTVTLLDNLKDVALYLNDQTTPYGP
mgnify:CR=1 FL=1